MHQTLSYFFKFQGCGQTNSQTPYLSTNIYYFSHCSFKYCYNGQISDLAFIFLCSSKSIQLPSECTIFHPCFQFFSAVPYLFKYRQNAQCTILVIKFFCVVSNCLNAVRMHHLPFLFSKFSLQFQIPSECTLYLHFFQIFQEATLPSLLPCFNRNMYYFSNCSFK